MFILKVFFEMNKEKLDEMEKISCSMIASATIAKYDKDGDGCLDKEEFLKVFVDIWDT